MSFSIYPKPIRLFFLTWAQHSSTDTNQHKFTKKNTCERWAVVEESQRIGSQISVLRKFESESKDTQPTFYVFKTIYFFIIKQNRNRHRIKKKLYINLVPVCVNVRKPVANTEHAAGTHQLNVVAMTLFNLGAPRHKSNDTIPTVST